MGGTDTELGEAPLIAGHWNTALTEHSRGRQKQRYGKVHTEEAHTEEIVLRMELSKSKRE
jgi:hypothetical protein